ncbi:DUF418 domain-containing protein [Echinicola soli]|uniref:DUF418 domain-containing protein n=1 Tax=Echinicola soli TaxID=2591634 RepID=A0A514CF71_9BACT|nr:DUF418 domain-containing protein [Echinicola soli]QDH78462.1 DUF418 domain-containing protein [Echinicola soli]
MKLDQLVNPISDRSRIELIDIFRGFAIFGIFMVNIEIMNCFMVNQEKFGKLWTRPIDTFSYRILQLFFYSKFFPIFSFLFGLGIGMQTNKFINSKRLPLGFLIRRMLILLVFGILHITFLWDGDILHLYALIGIFTFFWIRRAAKVILITSIIVFVFPFYDVIVAIVFGSLEVNSSRLIELYNPQEIRNIIWNGSLGEQISLRWADYVSNIPLLLYMVGPVAFSMFLLGLYFVRQGYHNAIKDFIARTKKPVLMVILLITAYRLFFIFALTDLDIYHNPWLKPIFLQLIFLSDVMTGLFYLWLMGWLYYFQGWKKLLSPLKYVGRMALSNYIFQSLVGLILFYGLGFSLYEKMSPPMMLLTGILVFAVQMLMSAIWLRYFRYGPLEWLWRVLSYGKRMGIKR